METCLGYIVGQFWDGSRWFGLYFGRYRFRLYFGLRFGDDLFFDGIECEEIIVGCFL